MRTWIVHVALLLMCVIAQAADAPATSPAEPTTAPAALSSPKEAAKFFLQALIDGDHEAARKASVHWEKRDQILNSRGPWYASWSRLEWVMNRQFGVPTSQPGEPPLTLNPEFQAIEQAFVHEENERATIFVSRPRRPIVMQKLDGQWKVDTVSLYHDVSGHFQQAYFEAKTALEQAEAQVREKLADDVLQGKFSSAIQVNTELKRRSAAAAAEVRRRFIPDQASPPPATQP